MEYKDKFQVQESFYEFPYHYIPHFELDGTPSVIRKRSGGLQYLCYQKHLIEKVLSMNPSSVLDVGCGDGYFIGSLPSDIPVRVGVDLSPKAIAFARAFNPDCTFYENDASFFEEQFDIVTAIEVIEHIPEDSIHNFLNILNARAKDDGRIIISMPTINMPLNEKHYRHYTKKLFINQLIDFDINLKIVDYEYIFARPWWYNFFKRLIHNQLFSLELKPFMRFSWNNIWHKYRIASEKDGCHLVVVLRKSNIDMY